MVIAELLSRYKLGNPNGLRLTGAPTVYNNGQMQFGPGVFIASSPVVSHLITEPTGTLTIGKDVAIGHGAAIYAQSKIVIGDGAHLGPFCVIADTDFHVIGDTHARPEPRPITIGQRVVIGAKVNILPGSIIGDDAIVLAGSTVAGNVAAGTTVGGVPAIVRSNIGADISDVEGRLRQLVKEALGLLECPPDTLDRRQIPQWDSLGALRLTLGVESVFSISLSEREVTSVSTVGDLINVVSARV